MLWFFLWILLSVGVGSLASNWGRSAAGWFFISALLSPIIGVVLLLLFGKNTAGMERDAMVYGGMIKCPDCAELIKSEANVCRYCGKNLNEQNVDHGRQPSNMAHISAAGRAAANQHSRSAD